MIDPARLSVLNEDAVVDGRYVLYWMQASQRATLNHALEYAVARANELGVPPLVCFGLTDDYPEANARHYAFMLEGLRDVERDLGQRGIKLIVRRGSPPDVALDLATDASLVVCDRGYQRLQRQWRERVADHAGRRVEQVESDAVVPVETASDHQETAARTLRPKVHRLLDRFLVDLRPVRVRHPSVRLRMKGDIDVTDPAAALAGLKVDRDVKPVDWLTGGSAAAKAACDRFVRRKLAGYAEGRREPAERGTSMLSAYLHFGQVSPLYVALKAKAAKGVPAADREAFLEELIVRRELAINFVHYNAQYDTYDALPAWARRTLHEHERDERTHLYSRAELESARTHDPYWNAAQNEMLRSGFMHNSMRMYWGKKVLEWKPTPREAFDDVLYLNNKYFLCGRDPNAFANVAWVFGLHDRPWSPRPVFGNVRYMNAAGLDRKFDMEAYVRRVEPTGGSGASRP